MKRRHRPDSEQCARTETPGRASRGHLLDTATRALARFVPERSRAINYATESTAVLSAEEDEKGGNVFRWKRRDGTDGSESAARPKCASRNAVGVSDGVPCEEKRGLERFN